MDDVKKNKRDWNLKKAALDGTLWRNRCG